MPRMFRFLTHIASRKQEFVAIRSYVNLPQNRAARRYYKGQSAIFWLFVSVLSLAPPSALCVIPPSRMFRFLMHVACVNEELCCKLQLCRGCQSPWFRRCDEQKCFHFQSPIFVLLLNFLFCISQARILRF